MRHSTDSRVLILMAALLLTAGWLAGCGVPGPDQPEGTFGLEMGFQPRRHTAGAVVFFVDGLNARIFEEMLDAGELPNIQRHFVDRGLYCPEAVANVPSVTLANVTSFVTGRYPGHHGVTGINWFDRNQLIWRNYETIAQKNTLDHDYIAPNIYEQFPNRTTFSLFFQPHRGATKFFENWTSAGPPFFFGMYELVDRISLYRFGQAMAIAESRDAYPAVTICYMLAPDFHAYAEGVSSESYRQAIRHTDKQIGRVLADFQRAGLLDGALIVLTSDHGLIDVDRHWPIAPFLSDRLGLRIAPERLWEETPFEKRQAHYMQYPAVLYGSGDRYWALCLRKPIWRDGQLAGYEAWPVRPDASDLARYPVEGGGVVNLLDELLSAPAVDALAYSAGANRVRVRSRAGEAEIAQPDGPGGELTYKVLLGEDPLGYASAADGNAALAEALSGQPHSPRWWVLHTAALPAPTAVPQLAAYFRARRAGDIAVFAAEGWDFGNRHSAGHGGLNRGEMCFPLILAGPGVPHGRLETAQAVDIMPTILHWLGKPIPDALDGQPLLP